MVDVTLKRRSDILCHPPYRGVNVSEEESLACVPDMLYMFLNLLLGGQDLLDKSDLDDDIKETDHASKSDHAPNSNKQEQHKHMRVLSIGQDIVYSVNGGKVWTPKHVGLGSSLHQATRSRQLIELFHEAGHTVSYRDVGYCISKNTLATMDAETGTVIPTDLSQGRFNHFTADNIDINESTLDGKIPFTRHSMQLGNVVRQLSNR